MTGENGNSISVYSRAIEKDCEDFKMVFASTHFELYEIIFSRYKDDEKEDLEIVSEEKVIASDEVVVKKYIEYLAKEIGDGEWEWNDTVYEQKDGKKFFHYERLTSLPKMLLI